jgi:hypothetical protein
MPATYEKAKAYMDQIVKRLQCYFPNGFCSTHSSQLGDARKVFVIEKKTTFSLHINFWYNAFFKKSVGVAFTKEQLGEICPGFTTPAGQGERVMYVQEDAEDGTLVHEFLHWLQAPSFYPDFYMGHAKGSAVLEGVTEYFTRLVYPGTDRLDHYDDYYDAVVDGINDGTITEAQLGAVAFAGAFVPNSLIGLF